MYLRIKVLLLMLVLILTACSSPVKNPPIEEVEQSNIEPAEVDEASMENYKNRVIKIGAMEYYPPYEFYDNGEMTGAGIEVIRKAFDRLGYDYEIKPYPWARMIKMMQDGELDVIVNIYETTERNDYIYFSETPYVVVPYVFFKRKGDDFTYSGDLEVLDDKLIGIVRSYSYGSKFNRLIEEEALSFDEAPSAAENFERLANGRIDLLIETYYTGIGIIEESNYENAIENVDYYINFNIGHLGFSKVNHLLELRDEYDLAIYDLINEGVYHQIFDDFKVDPPIAR